MWKSMTNRDLLRVNVQWFVRDVQLCVKNKIRFLWSLHVRWTAIVKMYQNRSDVMTRSIACIINNVLSIRVKWLQKNGLVYLSNLCYVDFYSWMCRWSAHFRKVALQTAHFGNFLIYKYAVWHLTSVSCELHDRLSVPQSEAIIFFKYGCIYYIFSRVVYNKKLTF